MIPPPPVDGIPDSASAITATSASKSSNDLQLAKWWTVIPRLSLLQLGCSLLMQLSYVAFPAYNFALALWCLACCSPKWVAKNPRLVPLHLLALTFSVVTDIIWMSLWVSGRVFYDQFCGQNSVTIVSCGGAGNHYPGCQTNRFALFTLIVDDLAKVATAIALSRVHALDSSSHSAGVKHHHYHHHAHNDTNSGSVLPSVNRLNNQSAIHQVPNVASGDNFYDPRSET